METSRIEQQKRLRDPDYGTRLKQIGDILARGVVQLLANEEREKRARQEEADRSHSESVLSEAAQVGSRDGVLLTYLLRFGKLRPCEIRDYLECSRATVSRMTDRLQQHRLIQREGRTSATTYSLTREWGKGSESHPEAVTVCSRF